MIKELDEALLRMANTTIVTSLPCMCYAANTVLELSLIKSKSMYFHK